MQHDKCLNHIQLNQQINTGSEHIPGSGRAEHSSCLLHSCTFQIHPAERSAWSQVPVSRGYFPASQTGQSSRKVVRPSPLPFHNQMSLILKENNYDVWSWVKIIAIWFGKKNISYLSLKYGNYKEVHWERPTKDYGIFWIYDQSLPITSVTGLLL